MLELTENYIVVLISYALILYALYCCLLPRPLPGIPYNAKATRSVFGDAPDMIREVAKTGQVMQWMASQTRKMNAPMVQVFVRPFCRPWVLLADYREAQDVLLRRGREFGRSSFTGDLMAPAGGFHLRLKTGKEWKAHRSWLQDLMTPRFLNNVAAPAIYDKALDLIKLWELKTYVANGRPFSAALDIHYAALDAVLAFTFGDSIEHSAIAPQIELLSQLPEVCAGDPNEPVTFLSSKLNEFIMVTIEGTEMVESIINSPAPSMTVWWMKMTPRYRKFQAIKNRFINEQIQIAVDRSRAGLPSDIVIRSAVDHIRMREEAIAKKQKRSTQFYSQDMVDEIFGNIVAGHDTTSSTLGWVLKFLTDYQDTQVKLRKALHSAYDAAVAETRNPTLAEVAHHKVPYLDAVVEEALRLSPISVTREAMCDVELLGHRIPKGTVVFFMANGPSFYEPSFEIDEYKRSPTSQKAVVSRRWDEEGDMRAFSPERWLRPVRDGQAEKVEFDSTAGPQLVFGLGTRSCFGKRLAYMEAKIITTMIIWNFELLPTPTELGGYDAVDGVTHRAKKCFVRLKRTRYGMRSNSR
ncbi:cytochrome P450 [Xylariaceae sp. AK1471]|nr:cytochrome P450 [Xylariaceae sp. AK1471]